MRFHRPLCAAASVFIAVLPVRADQILGPGRIDNSGNVRLPGGPLLGTMSGNKFISKPDAVQIQGSGSTGDISSMSATPSGSAGANTLAKLLFGAVPSDGNVTPANQLATAAWVRSFGSGHYNVLACLTPAQLVEVLGGGGSTDLTATIQACLNGQGRVSVIWPFANYHVDGTLTVPEGQQWLGVGRGWNDGSIITVYGSPSAPTIKASSSQSVVGLNFRGSTTAQAGHCFIDFEGNGGTASYNFFYGGYAHVCLGNAAFYAQIDHNKFNGGSVYGILGTSLTTAGFDFTARGNRFLGFTPDRTVSVARLTGLGSAVWSDNIVSVSQTSGLSVWLEDVAPNYGGWQVSNSVFEQKGANAAFYAQGVNRPIPYIHSVNSIYTGDQGPAVYLLRTTQSKFIGGSMGSDSTGGVVQVQSNGQAFDTTMSGVDLQSNASPAVAPIQVQANGQASFTFNGVLWGGSAPIFDGSAANSGAVPYFNFYGGNPGTNAQPFRFPAGTKVSVAYSGGVINNNLPTAAPTLSGSFWRDSANGNVLKVVP